MSPDIKVTEELSSFLSVLKRVKRVLNTFEGLLV
jgi:hypothetical protein